MIVSSELRVGYLKIVEIEKGIKYLYDSIKKKEKEKYKFNIIPIHIIE